MCAAIVVNTCCMYAPRAVEQFWSRSGADPDLLQAKDTVFIDCAEQLQPCNWQPSHLRLAWSIQLEVCRTVREAQCVARTGAQRTLRARPCNRIAHQQQGFVTVTVTQL